MTASKCVPNYKYVWFDKSPIGFHVYVEGQQHPDGYIKEVGGYRSGKFIVIHNNLPRELKFKPMPLYQAKDLITKLIRRLLPWQINTLKAL